jgi:hypothetical protein
MRFDSRFDRLSGEPSRGIAQDLQGRLVKCRREPSRLESRAGQSIYVLQPCGKRHGLRQCLPRIVGDDAAFLRSPIVLETVTAGAARQLRPWLRLHGQRHHIHRHPASKQVRVSGIREEGQLHSRGDL